MQIDHRGSKRADKGKPIYPSVGHRLKLPVPQRLSTLIDQRKPSQAVPRQPSEFAPSCDTPVTTSVLGGRGGRFVAREVDAADRDRLYGLATKLVRNYGRHAQATGGIRTIPVMRLTPAKASDIP